MKYVMNDGVRQTVKELDEVSKEYDRLTTDIAEGRAGMDTGWDKNEVQRRMAILACKILSHATKGKRYSNLTEGIYSQTEW